LGRGAEGGCVGGDVLEGSGTGGEVGGRDGEEGGGGVESGMLLLLLRGVVGRGKDLEGEVKRRRE